MKIRRPHLIFGAAVIALALGATVARTRAVQEWYDTVTVQGKMTAYLLDDRAAVNGLLLDGGQQLRLSPRLGEAIASRVKNGDQVSVVGRGGHASSFGRLVDARTITINGQTVTLVGEPEDPRGGPQGRGGRGPADGPGGPRDGRGAPPAPGVRGEMNAPPPPRPAAEARPVPGSRDVPPPPPAPEDQATPPVAPAPGDQPAPPIGPRPPAPAESTTLHGTVSTFLVGLAGEVRGLVLNTGEQVHFSPRVGATLTAQKGAAHPEVTVMGEGVRSEYGMIVRAAQLTVGSHTILVP